MSRLLCLLAALAATGAQAEIYACGGQKGMTVYQNFPCAFTSLGSVPTPSAATQSAGIARDTSAQTAQAPPRGTSGGKTKTASAAPIVRAKVAGEGEPRPGMSEDDVRKAWGEPAEVIQDEPRSGRVEIWRYKDGRSVQINRKHQVVAVEL